MTRLLLLSLVLLALTGCGPPVHYRPPWCDGTESRCPGAGEMAQRYWHNGAPVTNAYRNSFGAPSATCTSSCRHGRCTTTCF